MDEDWYRTPAWSLADQELFERKLRRARAWNRPQYLRIKGLELQEAGLVDAARTLLVRAGVEAGSDRYERTTAWENLADTLMVSDPAEAERLLRRILDENPSLNFTSFMEEVHLAQLLIAKGTPEALTEARKLLDSWDSRGVDEFSGPLFEAAVARTRLHVAAGETDEAVAWATCALELAEVESPLPAAPGLAVGELDAGLATWLADVAGGSEQFTS